jgi:hypothetical protein
MTNPIIHIIPDLKELSKTATGVSKLCGAFGFTDENCIGDFNRSVLTKRNNYHTGNNKFPNNFLVNKEKSNFNVVNAGLEIGNYKQNWNTLFQTINGIIAQNQQSGGGGWPWSGTKKGQQGQQPQQPAPSGFDNILNNATKFAKSATKSATDSVSKLVQSDKKKNVFISCHQHVLQNMFFKFKKLNADVLSEKDSCGKSMKQYGFRNCTCIKISNEGNKGITITVIHSENTGRDKFKYKYIDANTNLIEQNRSILVDGTYPTSLPIGCDIYMIRHGEAVHNLKDVYAVMQAKLTCNPTEAAQIDITKGNKEMLNKMKAQYTVSLNKIQLNALLTTQGIEQSNNLYTTKLQGIMEGKQNIYISSPMDRTIETLIFATSPNGNGFSFLKTQFMEMYNMRFPITASEIQEYLESNPSDTPPGSPPNPTWTDRSSESSRGSIDSTDSGRSTFDRGVPQTTPWYKKVPNPFRSNPTPQGGKRKSRRKVNKKSKKRKSVKARKTKKRSRNTKKRYQKGCSRK